MDYVGHFSREVAAFEAAGRTAVGLEAAPVAPSCPGWVVTDLILHLGVVHRIVARVIGERIQQPRGGGDWSWLGLAEEWEGLATSWPRTAAVPGSGRFARQSEMRSAICLGGCGSATKPEIQATTSAVSTGPPLAGAASPGGQAAGARSFSTIGGAWAYGR